MSDIKINALPLHKVKEAVTQTLTAGLVPIVSSAPGVGKSDMIKAIAKEHNLKLIDIRLAQCEPTDLLGLPDISGQKATYKPMSIFPLAGEPLPKNKDGWLLFLDEIRNADVSVQHAAYKLVLDRQIGEYDLHENVYIVCAGNREEDNCFVTPMPSALKSRLVHLEVTLDSEAWMKYAISQNFDARITTFMGYKPEALNNSHLNGEEETYACPRTWEFASKLIAGKEKLHDEITKALLVGTLGEGIALSFLSYVKYFDKIPTYEQVVKNPKKAKKPDNSDLGLVWATIGMLTSNIQIKDIESVMTYIEGIPYEFQFMFVKDVATRHGAEFLDNPIFDPWIEKLTDMQWSV